jgi:hypothetical protein
LGFSQEVNKIIRGNESMNLESLISNKISIENSVIIKKLRFLPTEELAHLVIKVYSSDDEKLKNAIKKVAKRNVRRPTSYILNCDSDKCIAILAEFGDLPSDHIRTIERLFKEYQYGSNPNLYFYQLISPEWKEFEEIKKGLPTAIEVKSKDFENEGENKYTRFKILDISKDEDVVEILFEYQRRIDYINPQTAEPAFVYTLEEGIAWIVKSLDATIIKATSYTVSSFINSVIREYLRCRSRSFSLHKNITNSILGKESLKSGSYYKLHAGFDEVEGKTIRDKHLMTKTEGKETDEKYDRKSSFHKVKGIIDSEIGLNINSDQGKLSIRKHLKKTEIRDWALEMIKNIIKEMTQLKESDISSYLKGLKLEDIESLQEIKKGCKEIIRDIVIGINKVKSKGKVNFSTDYYNISDLYTKGRDYFNFIFIPTCNSCGSNLYTCNATGQDATVSLGGVGLTATCKSCLEEFIDIPSHFKCYCGKSLEGGFDENILAIPTTECVELINRVVEEIGLKYKIESNELLKFSNGEFEIIPIDYKAIYLFNELPAFMNIPELGKIEPQISSAQLYNVKVNLGEKCKNYSDSNCRDCLINKKGHCLQRVIAYFAQGDLHGHSSVEFGDISFRQNLNGSSQLIVCHAKRYIDAPKINGDHKYTMKNDAGLLNQLVETIFDYRIDFLGIISGADLDPRLKESIIALVKLKHKRIVFFEKNDLVRILSQYEW